ncbi:hypothetical protein SCFA_20009 [anaerobic digester metagenome]|uniref:Uncharacterized protein n=1 Tax=anaerobic digester metagenome TaxID=1263854 RepID=A0A485M070_9ZZZZ
MVFCYIRLKRTKKSQKKLGVRTKHERTCPLFWRKGGQNNTCCIYPIQYYCMTVNRKYSISDVVNLPIFV